MKCGLIWARSARTSASISRVRRGVELGELELAGDPAGDLVGGPDQAGGRGTARTTCRVPTTRSSTTSGLTTACRTGQPAVVAGAGRRGRATRVLPCVDRRAGERGALVARGAAERRPRPAAPAVSVSATAGVPSRSRRCRMLRSALAAVSPSRSAGEASEAVCSVRKVARSASVPRWVRRHLRAMAHVVTTRRSWSSSSAGAQPEVDEQHVGVGPSGPRGRRSGGSGSPARRRRGPPSSGPRRVGVRPPRPVDDDGPEAAGDVGQLHAVHAAAVVVVEREHLGQLRGPRASSSRVATLERESDEVDWIDSRLIVLPVRNVVVLDEAEQRRAARAARPGRRRWSCGADAAAPRRRTHGIRSSRWFHDQRQAAAGLEHARDLGQRPVVVEPVERLRRDDDVDRRGRGSGISSAAATARPHVGQVALAGWRASPASGSVA